MSSSPDDGIAPVAAAYDRWSASYDADCNTTRDLDGRVLRAAGLPLAGARVLELGCGTGRNTLFIAAQAREVLALDFSAGMLAQARTRCADLPVRFAQQDLRLRLPPADGTIDLALTNLVLEHIEDLRPVFAEAARVLRPGGMFFVSELHPAMQRAGKQANFIDPATGTERRIDAHRHDVADFVNCAIDAGLVLRRLDEWRLAPTDPDPRLLTLLFAKP